MEEGGSSKAIPLRRSRASRAASAPVGGWTDALNARVGRVLVPARQLWLAGLGATALGVRGARTAWSRLVAEGEDAEASLWRALGREPAVLDAKVESATS
jgi:hypothetical protein